jgi:hypothetical protein
MIFSLRKNAKLRNDIGENGFFFLQHGLDGLTRILPHVEVRDWKIEQTASQSRSGAVWAGANRRELRVELGLRLGESSWKIVGILERRKIPSGVGAIPRTIDNREWDIADRVVKILSRIFGPNNSGSSSSLSALRSSFDERVVAEHLAQYHNLQLDLGEWLMALRRLAEQTYENKALAFGCIIDPANDRQPEPGARFPEDFLGRKGRKKYRALSDGYRTAYAISGRGAVLGFTDLAGHAARSSRNYPQWCEDLATEASHGKLGLALTRQGDILVLDDGHLTFTYRFGRWQYWNHTHLIDLIRNAARVQRVPPNKVTTVVRAIYRAALDSSFRRSGALFVLLRSRASLRDVVRLGDAVNDRHRDALDVAFDQAVTPITVQSLSRSVLAELASLDGAVVLSNKGDVMAYGAILQPKKTGKVSGTEGSRSKAAIGASNYGLAVKVSSDGDMRVYVGGKELISI